MGIKLPPNGLIIDAEVVEAWITAGTTDEKVADSTEAFLSAHAMAFTMQGHLKGTAKISGLSDDEARRQLQQAHATMDHLMDDDLELFPLT